MRYHERKSKQRLLIVKLRRTDQQKDEEFEKHVAASFKSVDPAERTISLHRASLAIRLTPPRRQHTHFADPAFSLVPHAQDIMNRLTNVLTASLAQHQLHAKNSTREMLLAFQEFQKKVTSIIVHVCLDDRICSRIICCHI